MKAKRLRIIGVSSHNREVNTTYLIRLICGVKTFVSCAAAATGKTNYRTKIAVCSVGRPDNVAAHVGNKHLHGLPAVFSRKARRKLPGDGAERHSRLMSLHDLMTERFVHGFSCPYNQRSWSLPFASGSCPIPAIACSPFRRDAGGRR